MRRSLAKILKAKSMIRLHTSNGYGSTNTKIRRFSTTIINIGKAISFTQSVASGDSFTINEDGVYSISFLDNFSAGSVLGVSLNSSELTTNIDSLTNVNDRLIFETTDAASANGSVSWTGVLRRGDIIRAHTNGAAAGAGARCYFTIAKVA